MKPNRIDSWNMERLSASGRQFLESQDSRSDIVRELQQRLQWEQQRRQQLQQMLLSSNNVDMPTGPTVGEGASATGIEKKSLTNADSSNVTTTEEEDAAPKTKEPLAPRSVPPPPPSTPPPPPPPASKLGLNGGLTRRRSLRLEDKQLITDAITRQGSLSTATNENDTVKPSSLRPPPVPPKPTATQQQTRRDDLRSDEKQAQTSLASKQNSFASRNVPQQRNYLSFQSLRADENSIPSRPSSREVFQEVTAAVERRTANQTEEVTSSAKQPAPLAAPKRQQASATGRRRSFTPDDDATRSRTSPPMTSIVLQAARNSRHDALRLNDDTPSASPFHQGGDSMRTLRGGEERGLSQGHSWKHDAPMYPSERKRLTSDVFQAVTEAHRKSLRSVATQEPEDRDILPRITPASAWRSSQRIAGTQTEDQLPTTADKATDAKPLVDVARRGSLEMSTYDQLPAQPPPTPQLIPTPPCLQCLMRCLNDSGLLDSCWTAALLELEEAFAIKAVADSAVAAGGESAPRQQPRILQSNASAAGYLAGPSSRSDRREAAVSKWQALERLCNFRDDLKCCTHTVLED